VSELSAGVLGLPKSYINAWASLPDRWFATALMWNGDVDECGYAKVYRVARLRVPSWGMLYDVAADEYRWGQRVLLYHGRDGFRIVPRFL
jgi:hypothetical protein